MEISNRQVAGLLEEIADLLEIKGESRYRVGAYRTAARGVENLGENVAVVMERGQLEEIPGVGTSIAAKIAEYLRTGKCSYLDRLRAEVPSGVVELLRVSGLGPRKVQLLHDQLRVTNVDELEQAAREHRVRTLPGLGEKSEEKLIKEIERYRQRSGRMLLSVAWPAAEEVADLLRGHPAVLRVEPAGSIRRRVETIGDIDLLAASRQPGEVMAAFTTSPMVSEVIAKGPTKSSILTAENLQIDLRVVDPSVFGAALQYFTGSKAHNVVVRDLAIRRGYKLSEYGLFRVSDNRLLASETEEEVYRWLGLQCPPPEMRENRGEVEAAAAGRLPTLLEEADIKGDLHVHTNWSDGSAPLERMAEAAIERGYGYLAITDHSQSLGIARGLTPERVREQRRAIDALNRRYADFRLLAGIELEIKADGSLDFSDDLLSEFDLVTASLHYPLGQDQERITARLVMALANPRVDLLNHPSGRIINRRPEYDVDMAAVIRAGVEHHKALEINASPERLDLNDIWARQARDWGGRFAIDTDAHSPAHFDNLRYGVAVARRAWVGPEQVINTLSIEDLLRYLGKPAKAA